MSISLIVSPFCQISYLDVPHTPSVPGPQLPLPADISVRVMSWAEVQKHLQKPPKSKVISWRDALSRKYRGQLGERLSWNEDSTFNESEDLYPSGLVLLSHTAASIDLLGEVEAARMLSQRKDVPSSEKDDFSKRSEAKGYLGKFPQLLLSAERWLPFRRDMIIEEPDINDDLSRFGSLFALRNELQKLLGFIRYAEPSAAIVHDGVLVTHPTVLEAADQCGTVMLRLTNDAIRERVPMTLST